MTRYTPVRQIKASERRPGMTYEFFEKKGKKVTRRWAGLKGEMEALRREHMKTKRNPEAIARKKYGWGTLYLKVDLSQASSPIRYSVDGGDSYRSTPFQTADARHSKAKAFSIVNRWLRGQNPTRSKRNGRNPKQLLFKSKAAAIKYAREHGAKRFSVRKLRRP